VRPSKAVTRRSGAALRRPAATTPSGAGRVAAGLALVVGGAVPGSGALLAGAVANGGNEARALQRGFVWTSLLMAAIVGGGLLLTFVRSARRQP